MFFIVILGVDQAKSSNLVGLVTNHFSPYGPLPSAAFTTNIYWINRTGNNDYADIIYQGTTIEKRLRNQLTPAGGGTVRISDMWNGSDDQGNSLSPGTYDAKVYISRTSVFDRKIPANARNTYQEFQEPRDIACDRLGNVYVFDRGLQDVLKFSSDGAFIWRWDVPAAAGLSFLTEVIGGIAVDTNLRIYLSGEGAGNIGRVSMINQSGTWLTNRDSGTAADDNFGGMGLLISSNHLITAAQANNVVCTFNASGFGTAAALRNNTATAPYKDFACVMGPSAGSYWIYAVNNRTIYRWSLANFMANAAPAALSTTAPNDSRSITSRSNKYLIVTSSASNKIRMISTNGTTIYDTHGSFGYGDTNFWAPSGVAWDSVNDLVWVSDTSNMRLVCYRIDAANKLQFVKKVETSPYITRNAQGITIDSYGNLYVVDNGLCKIKKFDQFGNALLQFGGRGRTNGYFINPLGIAVDPSGNIYVSDQNRNNIQKFSNNGAFALKRYVNQPRALLAYSTNIYIAKNNGVNANDDGILGVNYSLISNSWWWSSWQDDNADSFGVDSAGHYYLSDFVNANQDKFTPRQGMTGTPEGYLGTTTGGGVAIDDFDSIWVVRRGNNDVQVYATNTGGGGANINLFGFGSAGTADGQFNAPTMCAIRVRNLMGNWADLWVNDSGNNRLQKFIINWTSQDSEPVTIANSGRPLVTAAYPDSSLSTNVVYYDPEANYYVRQGKSIFKSGRRPQSAAGKAGVQSSPRTVSNRATRPCG